ncbi:zinc ABC transporter substrate-binding protein [Yoonia sp. I 8.24]|uniref:zinc ABC transporter substrate-binding protein n=1 Tax=Yoonia sp. I 8.24 TaxID=1537229 RepID=UPI001EDCE79C|nr:zinc ABC transporter substrate-binding protein [Yoonia sp. I 8.24]MCG3268361.1 zinc ABC transporter substrate-binding protein [Yoonia sp. I 8.24]
MSRKLLSLSLTAALMGGTAYADVPKVAVDIAPVHSLVSRVMDGVGAPNLVVQLGASPHEYSLRPSEARALQEADVVFWVSAGLTPWLADTIETLSSDASVTELLETDGTVELEFRENALFEKHDHSDHDEHEEEHDDHDDHDEHEEEHDDHDDHDEHEEEHDDHDDHDEHEEEHDGHDDHDEHEEEHDGHDDHDDHGHGAHDPHAWLSPNNAMNWLNVIAGQLSAADPENAGEYFANAAAGRAEIEAVIGEVNATLAPVRGEKFIVFHDAYQYFENDFDFPAAGAISIGDASDPSPARIAEIQARVADEGIDCVLAEPQFNPGLVATVLEGSQAHTGIIDPLGADLELGADFYPQLIKNLAASLAACQ